MLTRVQRSSPLVDRAHYTRNFEIALLPNLVLLTVLWSLQNQVCWNFVFVVFVIITLSIESLDSAQWQLSLLNPLRSIADFGFGLTQWEDQHHIGCVVLLSILAYIFICTFYRIYSKSGSNCRWFRNSLWIWSSANFKSRRPIWSTNCVGNALFF